MLRSRRWSFRSTSRRWSAASARVPIHPCVTEGEPRGEEVVRPAEAAKILDRRWPAARLRLDVVELDAERGPTDSARVEGPLAAAAVALPHRPLHLGGDVVRLRGPALAARLLDEPPPLRVTVEDELEPFLQDVRHARARAHMRERSTRRLQLLEEVPARAPPRRAPRSAGAAPRSRSRAAVEPRRAGSPRTQPAPLASRGERTAAGPRGCSRG
jgi:hypothetical protein